MPFILYSGRGSALGSYDYDGRNRLISLSGGGMAASSYGYDATDTRIRVTEAGVETQLCSAPLGGLAQVLTARRGAVEQAYIYTPQGQLLYELEVSTVAVSSVVDEESGETLSQGRSPARYEVDPEIRASSEVMSLWWIRVGSDNPDTPKTK